MSMALGRRLGKLEVVGREECRRRFGAAVVLLRETMAPEHARLVAGWMRERGLGSEHGDRAGDPRHPCAGRPNHACAGCIDRLGPPSLVRAAWVMIFGHVEHGRPVALPPAVARVYVEHPDAVPDLACSGCGYLLPTRGGRLAHVGACPACSLDVGGGA